MKSRLKPLWGTRTSYRRAQPPIETGINLIGPRCALIFEFWGTTNSRSSLYARTADDIELGFPEGDV
jgi:hypothetical protein